MTLANFLGRVDLGQFFGGRAKKYLRTPGVEDTFANCLVQKLDKISRNKSEIFSHKCKSRGDRGTYFPQ